MKKIWVVDSKYHKKTFRSEKAFLDFIAFAKKNKWKVNYNIEIYEITESHDNSEVYFDSFITRKERDEQLSVLLDNNIEIQTIQTINSMVEEHCKSLKKPHRYFQKYLHDISLVDSNYASFKNVISCFDIRRAFLYDGPSSVEWYKTILLVHNFKFEVEIKVGRNKVAISQERIENFQTAKKELKTKK